MVAWRCSSDLQLEVFLAFDESTYGCCLQAWALEDILSGAPISVERKCSQAAVTALCCGQDKLFVGVMQKIQVSVMSRKT